MNPAKLIMACQNNERGSEALARLKEVTGCKVAKFWRLDLADFSSVKGFADRFEQEGGRLDVLVENAAIMQSPTFEPTVDGWEPAFQVNNLSTSLLALLLLPRMIDTADKYQTTPRIVIVSSDTHIRAKFYPEMMESSNPLQLFGKSTDYIPKILKTRYLDTKLLNVLFARSFTEKLHNKAVLINIANPGYCYSGLCRNYSPARKGFDWLLEKALARTAEAGSRQLVWAAIGGEDRLEDMRGAYISLADISEPSDHVISNQGKADSDKLWDNLVDEMVEVEPKVQRIVTQWLQ